jgi:hypothetical protein
MPSPCSSIRSGARPVADLSEATEPLLRASGVAERCSAAVVSCSRSDVRRGWIPNFLAASRAVAGDAAESGSAYASLCASLASGTFRKRRTGSSCWSAEVGAARTTCQITFRCSVLAFAEVVEAHSPCKQVAHALQPLPRSLRRRVDDRSAEQTQTARCCRLRHAASAEPFPSGLSRLPLASSAAPAMYV